MLSREHSKEHSKDHGGNNIPKNKTDDDVAALLSAMGVSNEGGISGDMPSLKNGNQDFLDDNIKNYGQKNRGVQGMGKTAPQRSRSRPVSIIYFLLSFYHFFLSFLIII